MVVPLKRHKKKYSRKKKISCSRCLHPGFKYIGYSDNNILLKPQFQCDKCKYVWCYGYDGGDYTLRLQELNLPFPKKN